MYFYSVVYFFSTSLFLLLSSIVSPRLGVFFLPYRSPLKDNTRYTAIPMPARSPRPGLCPMSHVFAAFFDLMCRRAISFCRPPTRHPSESTGQLTLYFLFAFLDSLSSLLIAREYDFGRLNFIRFDQKSTVIEAGKVL